MTAVNFLCRVCSEYVNGDGWFIFGDDGKKNLLQMKIKLYLHFSVSEDDDLPKVMCNSCVRKLNNVHRFATMALCMQDRLRSCLGLHALQNAEIPSALNLFQTVSTEHLAPEEEKTDFGDEVMEVEVNVDPMFILGPEDDESDGYDDDVDGFPNFDDSWDISERLDDSTGTFNDSEKSDERPETHQVETQKDNNFRSGSSNYQVFQKQKPFVCTYCSRGFKLELSLRNHLWLHENPRSPSKLVLPPGEPKQGGRRKQPESREKEGSSSLDKKERKTELETEGENNETDSKVAEGLENNLCGVCRKSFESKSELVIHLESHYSQGKFGCSICCRVFWSKEGLEQHQTNHEVKHYTCKQCGRMYSTKGSLRQHLVTHSSVRPHKCALCPKTFKRNQDLKFHFNQHTGERPYVCPFCPKAFASSGNCFSHRKRMHPEEAKRRRSLVANGNAEG